MKFIKCTQPRRACHPGVDLYCSGKLPCGRCTPCGAIELTDFDCDNCKYKFVWSSSFDNDLLNSSEVVMDVQNKATKFWKIWVHKVV